MNQKSIKKFILWIKKVYFGLKKFIFWIKKIRNLLFWIKKILLECFIFICGCATVKYIIQFIFNEKIDLL